MSRAKKKSVKRGLTASGALDEMRDYCRIIATVAELLSASDGEYLNPQVVPDAGMLIADAVRELQSLIETLADQTR